MEHTDPSELFKAIEIYREREGPTNKTFNMVILDKIIKELKQKPTIVKKESK